MVALAARAFTGLGFPSGRLARALRFALPYRRGVALLIGVTLIVALVSAIEPLLFKYVFDGLGDGAIQVLMLGAGGLLSIALLREAANAWCNWLTWSTRLGVQFGLLEETIAKLHCMPLRMQRSEGVGAMITRLDRSIQGFIGAVTEILFHVAPSVLFLVISLVVMLQLEWRLALLVLAFAPMPALIAARAAPEQTVRERSLLDQWARIYSRFAEVLSGIVTVRSFVMEDSERRRFLSAVRTANQEVISGVRKDSGYAAASGLVLTLARIGAIAVGGVLVLRHEVTVGTLVAFLGYLNGLFGPVQGLSGIYQTFRKASVSLDEIFAILDLTDQQPDAPDAMEMPPVQGAVAFEQVRFGYNPQRPVLDGIDLLVRPGEKVAIVGPSGAGKTTLLSLLLRFNDPWKGNVRIDGIDVRSVKQASLRRQIGVVLQDPLLFDDSVRNNIAYGRPDATLEDIKAAAAAANAADFIERLPQGYDSLVGERGGLLSPGERQRITIARALIKNPSIVLLDEATSALDAESEEQVTHAIDRLLEGRTTFIIAHRLATVVGADRILVLHSGHIIESGSHAELMRARGYYASLVHRQSRGLIANDESVPA
jgi:ATP-binding cassette subfamily B protein